jgi:peptide/nickel transport system permease protein
MTDNAALLNDCEPNAPKTSELRRICKIFMRRKLVVFGLVVIVLTIASALFAPLLAPYNPYKINLGEALMAPSLAHPLGTDPIGRDILSRIIFGARTSLMIGVVAVGTAAFVGIILGMIAGYYEGWVNVIIMRMIDALMAFPLILLALIIAALLGGGLRNVMIALGIGLVPAYTRLMFGQVLAVKENDFILAGRAIGCSRVRTMWRHLLPNCFPPLIVLITMMMGLTILAEAGLSFLGIGIEAPGAAWGAMVNDGREYILTQPIISFAPGVAIMLVVFSFNMIGDGLRDALDPRLRGVL